MGICLEVSFDPGVTGATSIDRGRERNDVFKRMAEVCPCLCLCLYLRNTLATRHSLALTPRRLHVSLSPPLGDQLVVTGAPFLVGCWLLMP